MALHSEAPGKPRLSYAESRGEPASANETPVLAIHGNFSGKNWWRELLADPPPGSRLLAPDLPGFGESVRGRNFVPSMRLYTDALLGFLDDLGVEEAVLAGHSMGGAVAMQLALTEPQRFPGMLLLSPAPTGGLETPDYMYPLLKGLRHNRRALRRALKRMMRSRVPGYLEDLVEEARMMHPRGFAGNARVLSEWSLDGDPARYQSPVLVVSGDRDTLVPPSSAESTARAFPKGEHTLLSGVTHSPQIEAPEKVKPLFSRFLQNL